MKSRNQIQDRPLKGPRIKSIKSKIFKFLFYFQSCFSYIRIKEENANDSSSEKHDDKEPKTDDKNERKTEKQDNSSEEQSDQESEIDFKKEKIKTKGYIEVNYNSKLVV